MTDTMWVALLSLVGTLLGTLGGIVASQKLVSYRLEQLEKKVQAHNNLIDRMYRQEQATSLLQAEDKRLGHRIEILENDRGKTDG